MEPPQDVDDMDEPPMDDLATDPDARARWVHDLRNAINVLGVSTRVARRLFETGRPEEAVGALADGQAAWERCAALMARAPEATGLADPPLADATPSVEQRH